jgi:hypothetical protein
MISSEMPRNPGHGRPHPVMRGGQFTAEFQPGEATQEKTLQSAS